jgi:orotate phosphoribosyltransferase
MQEFIGAEAILRGHFVLSSGLHSDTYLQCARVMMDGARASRLCAELARRVEEKFGKSAFDLVVSPAMGGVIVGYELARHLNIPSIFCERVEGKFQIRRGFSITPGDKILVVEDVVTTGKSSLETFDCIGEHGGKVVAEASLIDRSSGKAELGVPLVSLLSVSVPTYEAANLPAHLQLMPAVKPGSRFIK